VEFRELRVAPDAPTFAEPRVAPADCGEPATAAADLVVAGLVLAVMAVVGVLAVVADLTLGRGGAGAGRRARRARGGGGGRRGRGAVWWTW
jgi:hypothetical protein